MSLAVELRKLQTRIDRANHKVKYLTTVLTPEEREIKKKCEQSLYFFAKECWVQVTGRAFIDGWHVHAICEHLEALYNLDIRDLLINQPFRTGKSIICSVIFPCWIWAKQPNFRFLCTSYSDKLSMRDSTASRRLVQSEWYQRLWGRTVRLREDAQNLHRFETTAGGHRVSTAMRGGNTGFGGDLLLFDDPNNIKTVESIIVREEINHIFDNVFSSRFENLSQRRRLVVQQRAHTMDLSGHILSKTEGNWVHLCLPMEFETHRKCKTIVLPSTKGKKWTDPREKEGELLWPGGIDATALKELKANDFNNDSYSIAGQLQQRPSPLAGGMIKKEWFNIWRKEMPAFDYVLSSWDTALVGSQTSAHSSCSTWGVFTHNGLRNVMLISLFTAQIDYPELRKMAIRLYNNYYDSYIDDPLDGQETRNPNHILIEAKVSGYSLAADLVRAHLPIQTFNPNLYGHKVGRARLISHVIENGRVWVPTIAPHYRNITEEGQILLNAAALFPNPMQGSNSNDIIDSMSQALITLKNCGWIYNTDDPRPDPVDAWKNERKLFEWT